ncbi:hypothetical protein BJX96DRAFT_182278 [Aspergillus floccosus]
MTAANRFNVSDTFQVLEHWIPCQHIREYPDATSKRQEDVLYLAVKQYVPWDNLNPSEGDISIIAAHGNGIPKGASSLSNKDKLGDDPSAFDHSRDLLFIINHCRDKLPPLIFGLGHSLVLIEPIVFFYSGKDRGRYLAAVVSARRRDSFPILTAAVAYFRRSKMFGAWDLRSFDLWIKNGLRSNAGGLELRVRLTTPKMQELRTFVRPVFISDGHCDRRLLYPDLSSEAPDIEALDVLLYRPEPVITFYNLPYLRPATMFMLRDTIVDITGIGISGSGGTVKGRVKAVLLENCGHFAPMEYPKRLAHQALRGLSLNRGP